MEEGLALLAFLMVVLIAVIVSPKAKKLVQGIVEFILKALKILFIVCLFIFAIGLIVGLIRFIITWLRDRWYVGDETLVKVIGFTVFISILPFLPRSIRDPIYRYYD